MKILVAVLAIVVLLSLSVAIQGQAGHDKTQVIRIDDSENLSGGCPDGFARRSASLDPSVDRNGNNSICEKRVST